MPTLASSFYCRSIMMFLLLSLPHFTNTTLLPSSVIGIVHVSSLIYRKSISTFYIPTIPKLCTCNTQSTTIYINHSSVSAGYGPRSFTTALQSANRNHNRTAIANQSNSDQHRPLKLHVPVSSTTYAALRITSTTPDLSRFSVQPQLHLDFKRGTARSPHNASQNYTSDCTIAVRTAF